MVRFLPLVIAFMVFSLFALSFINSGILLAEANEANQSIADYGPLQTYADQLNDTLSQYEDDVNNVSQGFSTSPISIIFNNFIVEAIGGLWKTIKGQATQGYHITTNFIAPILFSGSAAIILTLIGAIITLMVIISIYRMLFTGDGG